MKGTSRMSSEDLMDIELTGLAAEDPLGYLAAIGCLHAVDGASGTDVSPKLRFEIGGSIVPTISAPVDGTESLLDLLEADLERIRGRSESGDLADPFLNWSYVDGNESWNPDVRDEDGKRTRDLKPTLSQLRAFGAWLLGSASPTRREACDELSATLTDVATDRGGKKAKPFALHFQTGNQRFLQVAWELAKGVAQGNSFARNAHPVDRDDLRQALFGPWRNQRKLKVFTWSPSQERSYALRAADPSNETKTGNPGADWLALRALPLISSAPVGEAIVTSGVHGGWKSGSFTYPVWQNPLTCSAVRWLLRHPDLRPTAERHGVRTLPTGIELLTARIQRSDQGGYGAFLPPDRQTP